jgi:arylsulfatase A-like enzyme
VTAPRRPDVVVILTDQERAAPPYEDDALRAWRLDALPARRWFTEHGVTFTRHYTGSLACVPSRPTLFTGQYPDVHGVTQTDGLGKEADDSAMHWLEPGSVPTLGHWFRAAGYDTSYHGKWHISHADLTDPATGASLATNDDAGVVDESAVQAYLAADVLDPFGFSGWVGPEPHGGAQAHSGLRRDPLTAERAVAWLHARYEARRAGDADALRPFLLVASFVNPHDIVLFPGWTRTSPIGDDDPYGTPAVSAAPTADEDLSTKPAVQREYRDKYESGYAPIADGVYAEHAERYRRWYLRFHAEVDRHVDAVRRAVVDGSDDALLVLTSDHGELLGAHGGLHQKWFNAYEETVRVPFVVVRTGDAETAARTVDAMATSHVDVLPTLVAASGSDAAAIEERLRASFTTVAPLPGRNLLPVIDARAEPDPDRTVYLVTHDDVLAGDTGASVVARALGLDAAPPDNMRIRPITGVATSVEAWVFHRDGHWWKRVRTFDRHGVHPDEWELYDLTTDPTEATNLSTA